MNPAASFLSVLHAHAVHRGDQLAHVLPQRDITYLRLWSRIERAAARLQGEWDVHAGDLVAYIGKAHPDAIVLYLALLRIGATLLPLEAMSAADARAAFSAQCAKLAVHDEGVPTDGLVARPLEALLDGWSHHEPVPVTDEGSRRALWLPLAGGVREAFSLSALTAALPPEPAQGWVSERIFTVEVLRQLVLPSLRDGRRLQFSATESSPAARITRA